MIESGRHVLTCTVGNGRLVAVHGEFRGQLKNGERVSVGFADFFTFDDAGRIIHRKTFFDAPAV